VQKESAFVSDRFDINDTSIDRLLKLLNVREKADKEFSKLVLQLFTLRAIRRKTEKSDIPQFQHLSIRYTANFISYFNFDEAVVQGLVSLIIFDENVVNATLSLCGPLLQKINPHGNTPETISYLVKSIRKKDQSFR
jgi:hypothetical protein